jgi:hypothetical protein
MSKTDCYANFFFQRANDCHLQAYKKLVLYQNPNRQFLNIDRQSDFVSDLLNHNVNLCLMTLNFWSSILRFDVDDNLETKKFNKSELIRLHYGIDELHTLIEKLTLKMGIRLDSSLFKEGLNVEEYSEQIEQETNIRVEAMSNNKLSLQKKNVNKDSN